MVYRNSQQFVNELRKLHVDYFSKTNKLPNHLRDIQRDSVRDTTKRIISLNKLQLNTPKDNDDIFKWLRCYHNVLIYR